MNKIILLILLITQEISGQVVTIADNDPMNIAVYKDYVVFNKDTINRADENGVINGKGIEIFCDSTFISIIQIRKITNTQCSIDTTGFKCETTGNSEEKLVIDSTSVACYAVGSGLYKNGKKEGVWEYSGQKDISKSDAFVTFNSGEIMKIICYKLDNKKTIYLKADKIGGEWIVEWFNPETKKFEVKKGEINMICEAYHIDINGL